MPDDEPADLERPSDENSALNSPIDAETESPKDREHAAAVAEMRKRVAELQAQIDAMLRERNDD